MTALIKPIIEKHRYVIFGTPHDNSSEETNSINRISFVLRKFPDFYKNKIVVDMGCGFGTAARHLVDKLQAKQVIGYEINHDAYLQAIKRTKEQNIEYYYGQMFDTQLPDNFTDIITAVEVVEHVNEEELDMSLKEYNRILKPEGFLWITTPERRGEKKEFPKGSHWMEYEFDELIGILEKYGFSLVWCMRKSETEGVSMALLLQKEEYNE